MSQQTILSLTQLLISAIVALIIAWLTAQWALRNFRSNRFWELKVETYNGIFDALFDFDGFFRNNLHEEITGEILDEDEWEDLKEAYDDASYHLGNVVFKGEFIIAKEAIDILQELNKKLQTKEPSLFQDLLTSNKKYKYFKAQCKHIRDTIEKLNEIARQELKKK
jgi:hypothetical protein